MNSGKDLFNIKITLVLLGFILVFIIGYPFLNEKYEIVKKNREYKKNFFKFIENFNKTYKKDVLELKKRFDNFKLTLSFIENSNSIRTYGENVKFGITQFADLTDDEFKKKYLNDERKLSTKYRTKTAIEYSIYELPKNLPLKIDWREYNIMTDVRNQGNCGSCYAQSVIGTIESSVALNYNLTKPLEFSIQQMIDCGGNLNKGCLGGDTCDLLEWLKNDKIKILPIEFYPNIENLNNNKNENEERICKNITLPDYIKTAKIIKYTCLDFTGYEYEMLNILAHKGPLAASVNGLLWKNYLGGIIKYHCNGPSNHAIEIVGYDLTSEDPHYIIRNSWGKEFGNDGYAKISFGNNVCNIASEVSMVQVEWG